MKKNKKLLKCIGLGAVVGAVNGLFGAGGGIICVPVLMGLNLDRKTAHKNTVAVILPITLISAIWYLILGYVTLDQSLKFIPGGILGAALGTFILSKIPQKWIRIIFGGFMVWAGGRLLF